MGQGIPQGGKPIVVGFSRNAEFVAIANHLVGAFRFDSSSYTLLQVMRRAELALSRAFLVVLALVI